MNQPTKRQKTKITHAGRTIYLNNKELLIALKESNEQKKMTETLAKMLQKLCARYATKGNFVNYCVDTETEALTQQGWKNYNDITLDDVILSYDTENKQLTWSQILDIYRNTEYDGLMHKLTTQGMDALVTPNHKFVSSERGIIPVEDIQNNEHIILNGLPVNDQMSVYTNDFVELIGVLVHNKFVIVDDNTLTLPLLPTHTLDKIHEILSNMNIQYVETIDTDKITIYTTSNMLLLNIQSCVLSGRSCYILSDSFITHLTQHQRLYLIHNMIDDNTEANQSNDIKYSFGLKPEFDSFLMLCTLAGKTTTNTITQKYNGLEYNIIIKDKTTIQCKSENINFNGGQDENGLITPTIQYKGTIWCPQTEYGTFVCRRNGTVYITGNTYNEDMQGYAMLMLARTWQSFNAEKGSNPFAFFTQCVKHSFVQYLNQEKRHRNIRDTLMVQQGLSASFGFMEDSDQHFVDDEQDYEFHKSAASQLYQYNLSAVDAPIIRNEIGEFVDIVDNLNDLDDNNEITY